MSPTAVATPAERIRKTAPRATGKRSAPEGRRASAAKRLWIRGGLCGGILLLLAIAAAVLYRWSMTGPYFRIRRVEITGTSHLSRSVIQGRLRLQARDNLLAVDLDTLRRRIESHPWVRTVSLSRNLPGTLRVEVTERTPLAIYERGTDRYLIDEEGVILAQAGAGSEKFPVLRGQSAGRASTKERQAGDTLAGPSIGAGLQAMGAYRSLWPDAGESSIRLAAVNIGPFESERIVLMDVLGPKGQATLLRLSPQDLFPGLLRFSALVQHWRGKAWPGEVDLSMGSRVIVRQRPVFLEEDKR